VTKLYFFVHLTGRAIFKAVEWEMQTWPTNPKAGCWY